MKRSVQIARETAPTGTLIAGSVGSYGASLANGAEFTGDFPGMDEEKLVAWHRPRMTALIEAGCHILACETVPCLMEGRALVKLIDELGHPAWVTFSCRSCIEVCSGDLFADCIAATADSRHCIGSGVNCTKPDFVANLVRSPARNCLRKSMWSSTPTAEKSFVAKPTLGLLAP